jgi:hypothetical protein
MRAATAQGKSRQKAEAEKSRENGITDGDEKLKLTSRVEIGPPRRSAVGN